MKRSSKRLQKKKSLKGGTRVLRSQKKRSLGGGKKSKRSITKRGGAGYPVWNKEGKQEWRVPAAQGSKPPAPTGRVLPPAYTWYTYDPTIKGGPAKGGASGNPGRDYWAGYSVPPIVTEHDPNQKTEQELMRERAERAEAAAGLKYYAPIHDTIPLTDRVWNLPESKRYTDDAIRGVMTRNKLENLPLPRRL
jgi:hypothetical protein